MYILTFKSSLKIPITIMEQTWGKYDRICIRMNRACELRVHVFIVRHLPCQVTDVFSQISKKMDLNLDFLNLNFLENVTNSDKNIFISYV